MSIPVPETAKPSTTMPETTYTFAAVAQILNISDSKLRYWAQVGFVGPSVHQAGKLLFSFQDLIGVKAAKELVERGFTVTQIRKVLERVRASLPHVDRPLDRVRVAFDGDALVVLDSGGAFEISGQQVFDFGLDELAARARVSRMPAARPGDREAAPSGGSSQATRQHNDNDNGVAAAAVASSVAATPAPIDTAPLDRASAYEWFAEGLRAEADPARVDHAAACYRKALELDVGLAAAHTNLGHIAFARGDVAGARAELEAALALDPDQPEARFNLANLILDAGDPELAVAELRRVLQIAPDFADAHFNLAVALERLGGRSQARSHLERYLGLGGPASSLSEARLLMERLTDG